NRGLAQCRAKAAPHSENTFSKGFSGDARHARRISTEQARRTPNPNPNTSSRIASFFLSFFVAHIQDEEEGDGEEG
ncbi:unnamed protein product, partial [Sphagnum balticum]